MIIVNDLRPSTSFEYEGNIYTVLDVDRNKTAMRQMIVKVKVKNVRTGVINELSFTGGDKVEVAQIERKKMQYLYDSGDTLVFMDNASYDQIEIMKDNLKWEMNFLTPNLEVDVSMYENEILGIALPDKVELSLIECEAAVKGDTATSALKNAKCETGLEVKVPLFIDIDDRIIVSTIDGKYSSRA